MDDPRTDAAALYWLALDARLIPPDVPVAWADAQIAADAGVPDPRIIELSLSAGRPVDHVMDALRVLSPHPTPAGFRAFAALLHRLVCGGAMSEAAAANQLYRLHSLHGDAADGVLGREICCIDEYFEDWSLGDDAAPAAVREFLAAFASEPVPALIFPKQD